MLGDRASAGLGLLEDQHGGERGPLGRRGRDKSSILPQGRYRPPAAGLGRVTFGRGVGGAPVLSMAGCHPAPGDLNELGLPHRPASGTPRGPARPSRSARSS
jgi:hypothetical protein